MCNRVWGFLWLVAAVLIPIWAGVSRLSWPSIAIGPASAIALGLVATASEPVNYDMHGLALAVGIYGALTGVAVWLLARGLRRWLGGQAPTS